MKQPLQLAHGHFIEAGQLLQPKWLLQVGFHDRHHLAQLGLGAAKQGAQGHPLAFALATHAVAQQQFGGLGGDVLAAFFAGHQLQHHVHGRHTARAGVAVAVQFEQLARNDDTGELLLQRLHVFPVDGAAVTLEQLGLGQQVTARADAAQRQVLTGQLA